MTEQDDGPSGWRLLFADRIKELSKETPKEDLLTSQGHLRFEFCLEIAKLISNWNPIEPETVKCDLCGVEIHRDSAWVANFGESYICSSCATTMRKVK